MSITNKEMQTQIATWPASMKDAQYNRRRRIHILPGDVLTEESNQQEQWLAYLKANDNQDFDFIFALNHIRNTPMLLYLVENLGIDIQPFIKEINSQPTGRLSKQAIMRSERRYLQENLITNAQIEKLWLEQA